MKRLKLLCTALILCLTSGLSTGQSQKKLFQELWSNSNCGPCASTHNMMEAQVAANQGDVIYIGWHCNYPDPSDPMYLENTPEHDYMMNFYQVFGVPDMPSNGDISAHLFDQPDIDSVLALTVPIELHPQLDINGSTLDAEVKVLTTDVPPTGSNLVLRVAVTETLDFQTPPGSIGLTHFPDVFRKYLTDMQGDAFVAANNGDFVTHTFSMQIPQHWDPTQLKIKAWVIDTTDLNPGGNYPIYDVINSAEASPQINTSIEANEAALNVAMYPNPANDQVNFDVHATVGGDLRISVCNTVGQIVLTEQYSALTGNNRFQLNINTLSAGSYLVRIEGAETLLTRKLLIQ